ncbi:MAG: hypothetical protein IIU05_01090, partial [Bacteroidales bacterium]|nr:hypothetical protein [Bacteroidales bacterium]
TFRTAAAEESIRQMAKAFPEMIVGAGTVLTTEQADRPRHDMRPPRRADPGLLRFPCRPYLCKHRLPSLYQGNAPRQPRHRRT